MHQMEISSWIRSLKLYSNATAQFCSCSVPSYFLSDQRGLPKNDTNQRKKIQTSMDKMNLGGSSFADPHLSPISEWMISSHQCCEARLLGQVV